MRTLIIHPNEISITILVPTGEIPIEEVAKKDVPLNVPYLFISENDIPDLEFHAAFEVDFSNPDGVGADYGAGSTNAVIEYHEGRPTKLRNDITGEIFLTEYGQQLASGINND